MEEFLMPKDFRILQSRVLDREVEAQLSAIFHIFRAREASLKGKIKIFGNQFLLDSNDYEDR